MSDWFNIGFADGKEARVCQINEMADLAASLRQMQVETPLRTLLLIGGASKMTTSEMARLRPLFVDGLARLAENHKVAIVDGGTDAGVMKLMGQARQEIGGTFPLIGVAARGTIFLPEEAPPANHCAALEPNHTHFFLVPGNHWGDEGPWLAQVANLLSENLPSLTVLVNGGENSRKDLEYSRTAGRRILVIAGSGRLADELAQTGATDPGPTVIDLASGLESVRTAIDSMLQEGPDG